jgi:uncharacterized protein (TIGR02058 family)
MALKRMALQIGMGTDIRGTNATTAATRALQDAIRRNALTVARAFGQQPGEMQVEVRIGVPDPETVDRDAVLAVLPYGSATLEVVSGGLKIPHEGRDDATLIAHAATIVRLDLP